jgi:hypothetical protein
VATAICRPLCCRWRGLTTGVANNALQAVKGDIAAAFSCCRRPACCRIRSTNSTGMLRFRSPNGLNGTSAACAVGTPYYRWQDVARPLRLPGTGRRHGPNRRVLRTSPDPQTGHDVRRGQLDATLRHRSRQA